MTKDLPWFKVFHADEIADTLHLSLKAKGAYFNLMLHYSREGRLPDDGNKVRRIAGAEAREWTAISEELRGIFTPDWRNERWDRLRAKEQSTKAHRAVAGRAGAVARWGAHPAEDDGGSHIPF